MLSQETAGKILDKYLSRPEVQEYLQEVVEHAIAVGGAPIEPPDEELLENYRLRSVGADYVD